MGWGRPSQGLGFSLLGAVGLPFAGGPTGLTLHEKVGCCVDRSVAPPVGGFVRARSAPLGNVLVCTPVGSTTQGPSRTVG